MNFDDFEPSTENQALKDEVLRAVDAAGGITFRDYMDLVLYHPVHGYYRTREPMGRAGDYVTSPEVHPIFGALIGRQLREMWDLMGCPSRFDVVEWGPGTGLLARDVLRWASRQAPAFASSIRYTLVESSERLASRQRATLAEMEPASIEWAQEPPDAVEGCVLSNEFADALPVHRVKMSDGELREVFVVRGGAWVAEELRPPSTPGLAAYFDHLGLLPGEGCYAEVNLAAVEWMRCVARSLRRGFALTLDYGYEAADLYAPWRRDGTLLCFYHQNPSHDPYARAGRQDITASVDFTTLTRAGEDEGLTTLGLTTQARFLSALGIGAGVERALDASQALEEYYARRNAVVELLDPAGLGRIRVLIQARGCGAPALSGLQELETPGA